MGTKRFFGLVFFCLVVAASASATATVYPTGKSPDDAKNVQKALDENGEVLLKASNEKGVPTAFEFGQPKPQEGGHQVVVMRDIILRGETVHGRQTTIKGGFNQLVCMTPCKTEITGIHFQDATASSIFIFRTSGIKIWGNRITHVLPGMVGDESRGRGIWSYNAKPGELSGRMEISQNLIEGIGGSSSYGISLSNSDADVTVSQNTVSGTNLNAILVGYTSQSTWITQNRVTPGNSQKYKDSIGNGILVGHARGGVFHIIDNVVKCENPLADGIVVVGSDKAPTFDSQVLSNDVTMIGSTSSAIGLYGEVSRTVVVGNRIKGTSAYAVQIAVINGDTAASANRNTIVGNVLSDFKSSTADLFLNTISNETVAKANGWTVLDKGANNRLAGFQSKP